MRGRIDQLERSKRPFIEREPIIPGTLIELIYRALELGNISKYHRDENSCGVGRDRR